MLPCVDFGDWSLARFLEISSNIMNNNRLQTFILGGLNNPKVLSLNGTLFVIHDIQEDDKASKQADGSSSKWKY